MRAGPLNKRARFERELREPDGGGGYALAWQTVCKRWAALVPERGQERFEAGRVAAPLAAMLRVRSDSATRTITERDRVTIDGVRWNIRSIANPDSRNDALLMTIERDVAI